VGAAAAGAIAGASKFLIAIRGRHFLNPAATGTAIAAVLGLSASFWWVANPPMTPFIVLAGVLVVWRAGLTGVVGTGLLVGAVALVARLLTSGDELWSSLYLIVTSYPLVFLALFMLSEPLTLPPRSRQRHLVAVVVGLGVALPFSLPLGSYTLYSSPELAVLLGNLVALGATLATRFTRATAVSLVETTKLGHYGAVFRFSLEHPLRFRAGQWVELYFPHRFGDSRGQRRVFSVASPPQDATGAHPTIDIATRLATPSSSFKHALLGAPATSRARISQVAGDFVLPANPHTPLLLIAGGVGVTPFLSQLGDLVARGHTRNVVLIDVRRSPGEAWNDDLIAASGAHHIITSRDGCAEALDSLTDVGERWCAVSGSPHFVAWMKKELQQRGITRVATDTFTGY
jgi:glycine betaine catabolism B